MTDATTPAPADPTLPAGARVGVFEIRQVLSRSAAATVYLATDHALEIDVALQEYLPSRFVGRDAEQILHALDPKHDAKLARGMQVFIAEARMLARCDHPSLVRVSNLFEANQTVYSVMPHHVGQRLSDLRADIGAPPDEASLRALLDSLLGALEAIHRSGQVHGGVTAANILVLGNDRPLLLGPGGVDKVIGSDLVESLMATLGSPSELPAGGAASKGAAPSGAAADLYALAQVIRFCILGEPAAAPAPPTRESLAESIVETFAPQDRPRYSAALLSALDAAVSPVVDDRPVSVAQWRDWLDHSAPRQRRPPEPPAATAVPPRGAGPVPIAAATPVSVAAPTPRLVPPREPAMEAAAAPTPSHVPPRTPLTPPTPPHTPPPPEPRHTAAAAAVDPMLTDRAPWVPNPPPKRTAPAKRWRQAALIAGLAVVGVGVVAFTTGAWNLMPSIALGRLGEAASTFVPPALPPLPKVPVESPARDVRAPSEAPPTREEATVAEPPVPSDPAASASDAAAGSTLPETAVPAAAPVTTTTEPAPRAPEPATPSRPANPPVAAATVPASPRASCEPRTAFALYRCMQQQCQSAQWSAHAQCVRLRATDEVD